MQAPKAALCEINAQRARFDLPALVESRKLDHAAQAHSQAMARSHSLDHGDFTGRISHAGYKWQTAGENIAEGYSKAKAVTRAWLASTGHCKNLLSPLYKNVGIGYDHGYWTEDFGTSFGTKQPSHRFKPADTCPHNLL